MIAVQGPAGHRDTSLSRCSTPTSHRPPLLPLRPGANRLQGLDALASRTGYTGEDGFEIIFAEPSTPSDRLGGLARHRPRRSASSLAASGRGTPSGSKRACRSTGTRWTRRSHPYDAGLGWAVRSSSKGDFVGRAALVAQAKEQLPHGPGSACAIEGKRIARQGCDGLGTMADPVGVVTSGTFSPTLDAEPLPWRSSTSALRLGRPGELTDRHPGPRRGRACRRPPLLPPADAAGRRHRHLTPPHPQPHPPLSGADPTWTRRA